MARSKWISFGAHQALERAAAKAVAPPPPSPAEAKKFGLENFGNTCYANSVLQALYFCTPFRELVLQDVEPLLPTEPTPVAPPISTKPPSGLTPLRRKPLRQGSTVGEPSTSVSQPSSHPIPSNPPTLYSALRSLFLHISTNPGDKGTVAPRAFIDKLKELNELFRSTMHQDAHEFLNYLLNRVVEEIEEERRHAENGQAEDLSSSVATLASKIPPTVITTTNSSSSGTHPREATLVHKLFEGVLTSETRCLTCETVSSRDESFLDLSIDIEQNSSVTACLRQFSASEMLCQRNKFFCDACCDLQEAEKRMKIKRLPNVLALHLKRFKYQEDVGKNIKLAYRVAFPFQLRLFNTVDDIDDADRLYNLFAIVVHIGNGPYHGHYVSIIKTASAWLLFDDDNVSTLPESDIPKYFGDSLSGSAYVLYYQAVDIDLASLGLRSPEPSAVPDVLLTPSDNRSSIPVTDSPHILPPGLHALPTNGVPDFSQLPPLSNRSSQPSTSYELPDVITPTSSTEIPPVDQDSSILPPPSPSSPTMLPSLGTRVMNSIRRVPSVSAGATERPDVRRSISERSPRPSSSTPSLGASVDDPNQEPPPPVPPLPPNVVIPNPPRQLSRSTSTSTPTPVPQLHEPEKEKSKASSNWFTKKRKSIRVTDKGPSNYPPASDLPPSPVYKAPEEASPSHSHWFRPTTSNGSQDSQVQYKPSEHVQINLMDNPELLSPLNGETGRHSPGSRSSSPSSTSLSTSQPAAASGSRPSTGASTAPSRKPSILSSNVERPRTSVDHKKSLDMKAMSPSHANPSSVTQTPDYQRSLPPLPPTPKYHRSNLSNGTAHIASENLPKTDLDSSTLPLPLSTSPLPWQASFSPPGNGAAANYLQPPSIGVSAAGGNNHSAESSSSNKRATRKLSLTGTMLGFGRKDKLREKDRTTPGAPTKF